MPDNNIINSNFRKIALADANDNVTGISVASPAGLVVGGGTNGQVLSTNGSGTLSWATPSGVTATNGRTIAPINNFTAVGQFVNSLAAGTQIITVTLPAIGTYDITFVVQCQPQAAVGAYAGLWNNTTGAAIADSQLAVLVSTGGSPFVSATNRILVTTAAINTVIALRAWTSAGSAGQWIVHGGGGGMDGRTSMTWVRIA
jgi:hypothetical protein